jgi:nitrite reductase/ring-hydroxylating ferredoxin subunit
MVFAAKVTDIEDWGKKVVTVNGLELLLVKTKGTVYACENECPHQGSPMAGGIIKDAEHITCPRHGYKFNLKNGSCPDASQYTLKVYPTEIQGDDIMVELG